jgi:hypothetical protein
MKSFRYSILCLALMSFIILLSNCNSVSSPSYRSRDSSFDWSDWLGYDESCRTYYSSHGDFGKYQYSDMAGAYDFCGKTEYKYLDDVTFIDTGLAQGYIKMIKCCKQNY